MIAKTKIVFSLILASLLLIGMAGFSSATTECVEESYDSGWLTIISHVDSYSGTVGVYNGNWYIDDNDGILTIETPTLGFAEDYTLYIKYGIGTGKDIATEDFQVVCGGDTFSFPDDVLEDNPQTLTKSMTCTLNTGKNYFNLESTNVGSVHLYEFKLIGEKTCDPVAYCGDGIVNQPSEECDDGNSDTYDSCANDCSNTICEFEFTMVGDKNPVSPGDLLGYEIYLENIGTGRCTGGGVQLKEYYDPFTSFLISSPLPTSGEDLWNFGTMYPGESKTVIVDTVVSSSAVSGSTLNNTACVWANELADWICISEFTNVIILPECGDGNLDSGETCDWGILNGNTCDPLYDSTCDWCNNACELITETGPYCGDTICGAGEDCSLCEADCGVCPPGPYCGNGVKEYGEECDDGNTENDDGCSSICRDEENHRKKPVIPNQCIPNWECFGWSECDGDVMTRTCIDDNQCEIQYNEPYKTTSCDVVKEVKEEPVNNMLWFFLGILLLIILLIILVNLLRV